MMLEPILGYKSTWRILGLLLETPRRLVGRTELFRYTKLGNAPLSKGLDRLIQAQLIILEKKGKKEFYYINERNEFLRIIKELWIKEKDNFRNIPYDLNLVLAEFIRGINESCWQIQKIILFGSQARGTASTNSDIDLAVIFENDLKEEILVTKVVHKIEKQFKVKLQVHFFTEDSFKGKLAEEVKREGIELG